MAKKVMNWKTKGMNRDLSVSSFNAEFAYENINLRLSTNEGNTMMSWVCEKGTKEMSLDITYPGDKEYSATQIEGTPIGTAVINHKLVIFSAGDTKEDGTKEDDIIYVFTKTDDDLKLKGKIIYRGNLNLDVKHPIETLCSYESETIQKVYWVDGKNQPRLINLIPYSMNGDKEYYNAKEYNSNPFDFIQELSLNETITVTKELGAGEFPAGVIQYAFTYYNRYGQESNIFYTTPLNYISYVDRGGGPDAKIANAFRIKLKGLDDHNFDYVRIYSILRTTKDATPFVKRIQDIQLTGQEDYECLDDGLKGDNVDPTELLYVGGDEIVVKALEQKDNTLFLGNIEVIRPSLASIKEWGDNKSIKDRILETLCVTKEFPTGSDKASTDIQPYSTGVSCATDTRKFKIVSKEPFTYISTLTNAEKSEEDKNEDIDYYGALGFKYKEYYRLGIQFQYKTGKWSEPCWIGDAIQTQRPKMDEQTGVAEIPIFKYALNEGSLSDKQKPGILSTLYKAGYRKARAVFMTPSITDRTILCQGVGCPTMFRSAVRYTEVDKGYGPLYAQSSWLFRVPNDLDSGSTKGYDNHGGGVVSCDEYLYSQFEEPVKYNNNGEYVSCSPWLRNTEVMGEYDADHTFQVDDFTITLHSPDYLLDTSYVNIDYNNCKVKEVGYAVLGNTYGDIDIQTSTSPIGSSTSGFLHKAIVTTGAHALISGPFYEDYIADDNKEGSNYIYQPYKDTSYLPTHFNVYMWHKNGSLNNDVKRSNQSAELLKKKISNYRCSTSTHFFDSGERKDLDEKAEIDKEAIDIQYFNSDQVTLLKIDGHPYLGNVEQMVVPTTVSPQYLVSNPVMDTTDYTSDINKKVLPEEAKNAFNFYSSVAAFKLNSNKNVDASTGTASYEAGIYYLDIISGKIPTWVRYTKDIGDYVKGLAVEKDPVSIKYKSTPHIVTKLGEHLYTTNSKKEALPVLEVTRDYNKDTIFGGTSDEALQAATWIPCGPPVKIEANTTDLEVLFKWGDTFFQRYECLKTYPFTNDDKNQVIEIASFMCETRVNLDGRYDRNRAQTSNLNMSPTNFNLINPVYSQLDNFFNYKIVDDEYYKNTSYPNNITWTKTKENGADIDLWTNITLASLLDLDGDKGSINKIVRLNDQLITFQDTGIAQILYNENTQISTSEGVPIELANSGKVQGKRYLSNTIGCSNKWSVLQTPNGIYFIDSNSKGIYLFNGQVNNISTSGGFNSWAKQNIPSIKNSWNPVDFNDFVSYYDKLNQEALFINKDTALAYTEKFNCFSSFYSYGNAPYLVDFDDINIWIKDGILYKHQAGGYCNFFGENKPYSMTLVGNQDYYVDKIFTNLEFRASVAGEGKYIDSTSAFTPFLPFDYLEAWDEYQHGITTLSNRNAGYKYNHSHESGNSFLNRKFRIWRCDIPRDNALVNISKETSMGIKRFKARPLERLRNPWVYLKLEKTAAKEESILPKAEVHDIMAIYYA